MARLSLTDDDKGVRDWFKATAEALECEYAVDEMGNQFAVRSGKTQSLPIMMGSHLDTQPTGGRYDGVLGVLAGLEVLKVLHENRFVTEGSVGVVNWTNEEGARFPKSAVSSGVWAGEIALEDAWDLAEVVAGKDGRRRTMREELERIGYLGSLAVSHRANPFAAHFELHIEQGPILELEQRKIGAVEGGQAYKWFEIIVSGRDSHAGTTPMNNRIDAMLCAARCILASNTIAQSFDGMATTGIIEGTPQSINTMPKEIRFTLDIRHRSDKKLQALQDACQSQFDQIAREASGPGCQIEWKQLADNPAAIFDQDCIAAVRDSAIEVCEDLPKTSEDGQLWKVMTSGAGHDSCYTSKVCPTAMIFTVTKDGISHNPREHCSAEDCALGAQVLLGAVLRYDKWRARQPGFSTA